MLRKCWSPFQRNIHNFANNTLIHSHLTRHGSTLIVGEHSNGILTDSTKSCITAASEITTNDSINVLISGLNCENIATETSKLKHVSKVIYCDDELYSSFGLTENHSNLICSLISKYSFTHVLGGISSYTKDVLPRCAGILDISQISDCIKIINENTFQRGIYAGNAICNIQSKEDIKLITIRPTSFDSNIEMKDTQCDIEKYEVKTEGVDAFGGKQFIGDELTASTGPSLTSASCVISGGRGMKNSENFEMLRTMCELIPDCAMGASRAAVDAGYVANDLQVGQTGKCVAPNLYIAVGISGAIQHIAGMKDSKLIIAINNDPEAPIFSIADYGLCADLFDVVPKLNDMLTKAAK